MPFFTRLTFLLLLLPGLLSSCATPAGLVRGDFRPATIRAVPYATPVALMGLVQHRNRLVLNEQLTAESVRLMRQLIAGHQTELCLRDELILPDSLYGQAAQEIYRAVEGIRRRQRLEGGAHLPVLNQLLQAQAQRYVFVTATRGFTRRAKSYGGQPASRSRSTGLLTTDRDPKVPVAMKAKSNICVFVYDRQQNQIVYYNHTPVPAEHEPLDAASVEKQLRKLLARDFPLLANPASRP